jgi:hypothetical protein
MLSLRAFVVGIAPWNIAGLNGIGDRTAEGDALFRGNAIAGEFARSRGATPQLGPTANELFVGAAFASNALARVNIEDLPQPAGDVVHWADALAGLLVEDREILAGDLIDRADAGARLEVDDREIVAADEIAVRFVVRDIAGIDRDYDEWIRFRLGAVTDRDLAVLGRRFDATLALALPPATLGRRLAHSQSGSAGQGSQHPAPRGAIAQCPNESVESLVVHVVAPCASRSPRGAERVAQTTQHPR